MDRGRSVSAFDCRAPSQPGGVRVVLSHSFSVHNTGQRERDGICATSHRPSVRGPSSVPGGRTRGTFPARTEAARRGEQRFFDVFFFLLRTLFLLCITQGIICKLIYFSLKVKILLREEHSIKDVSDKNTPTYINRSLFYTRHYSIS